MDPRSESRHHLRARAVQRVTPADIGQRVSIRHLVDDGDGPTPTDVVARLLGFDHEVLALVDRDAQLVLVDAAAIMSSRVVPPHPRLPPEPDDVGTPERPLDRDAARIVLLDPHDRILLAAHRPSADRLVWTAPGGGLRPDEDHVTAARREAREELGLDLEIGPWVWHREVTFPFAGIHLHQRERWHLTRGRADDEVAAAPLGDPGLETVRWWTLPQLRDTDETLAPAAIADHLEALLRDGPPTEPVDVGR